MTSAENAWVARLLADRDTLRSQVERLRGALEALIPWAGTKAESGDEKVWAVLRPLLVAARRALAETGGA